MVHTVKQGLDSGGAEEVSILGWKASQFHAFLCHISFVTTSSPFWIRPMSYRCRLITLKSSEMPVFWHLQRCCCRTGTWTVTWAYAFLGCPFGWTEKKQPQTGPGAGGVCLYLNDHWWTSVIVKEKFCTVNVELLTVSLHPHDLPQGFCSFSSLLYIFIVKWIATMPVN